MNKQHWQRYRLRLSDVAFAVSYDDSHKTSRALQVKKFIETCPSKITFAKVKIFISNNTTTIPQNVLLALSLLVFIRHFCVFS